MWLFRKEITQREIGSQENSSSVPEKAFAEYAVRDTHCRTMDSGNVPCDRTEFEFRECSRYEESRFPLEMP